MVPRYLPWDRQPDPQARLNPAHPLGAALDRVWVGDSLAGYERAQNTGNTTLTSGTARVATSRGFALTNTGTTGSVVAMRPISAFPYVHVGYGYFASSGGAWALETLSNSGGGYLSRIALASSTTVALDLRFNFGTQRTVTITLPTTVNVPICMIAVVYSSTDYRFFANGQQANGTLTPGTLGSFDRMIPIGDTLNGGFWLRGQGFGRPISDAQALAITANPDKELWRMFAPRRIWVPVNAAAGAATHTTTGALAAGAAVVAGTALHPHTSTGALAAQAAVVAGAALHPHTTTGALAADAAVVAGTAAHITIHATTGALTASSAVVSGDARDETQYLPPRNTGAGKSKRKKRDRLQVEVDGEVFEVASRAEAEAVLEQAKEQAQKVAEQAIERATKAKRRPVKKVLDDARNALKIPAIAATPELSGIADDVRKYIEDLYSQAFETIEIAAHLARREREDEDDEDLLLLLL